MNEDILAKNMMLEKSCWECKYRGSGFKNRWCYLNEKEPLENLCQGFVDFPKVEITLPFSGKIVTASDTRLFPIEMDTTQIK
jgi:hypothetical protein